MIQKRKQINRESIGSPLNTGPHVGGDTVTCRVLPQGHHSVVAARFTQGVEGIFDAHPHETEELGNRPHSNSNGRRSDDDLGAQAVLGDCTGKTVVRHFDPPHVRALLVMLPLLRLAKKCDLVGDDRDCPAVPSNEAECTQGKECDQHTRKQCGGHARTFRRCSTHPGGYANYIITKIYVFVN